MDALNLGDVVQLNSGGAPMTIVRLFDVQRTATLTSISKGGMVQAVAGVPFAAFHKYEGRIITAPSESVTIEIVS